MVCGAQGKQVIFCKARFSVTAGCNKNVLESSEVRQWVLVVFLNGYCIMVILSYDNLAYFFLFSVYAHFFSF